MLIIHCLKAILDFNPRSSCEERLEVRRRADAHLHFNPRSSCEERLDGVVPGN